MIALHLPVLQVLVPLIAAPLCAILPRGRLAWGLTVAVSWAAFVIAAALLAQTADGDVLSYALGNWAPPFGIEFRVDAVNALVLLIVAGISAVVLFYARHSIAAELPRGQQPLVYTALLLCLSGLLGVTITGDAFNLFVFLEISSLSTYILVGLGGRRDQRALTAAYTYLVMGTIGATFYIIGVGYLYMMTGTLNMADLARLLPALEGQRAVRVAFAFLTVGIGLKLALFPLHLWLPNAYTYAPSAITAFLAATSTKVAVYVLLRVVFTIFGPAFAFERLELGWLVLPLALIGIFAGSTVAIFQDNIKRMLAYSSVAQIGYMLLGFGLANLTGLTASLVHLFNHAVTKGALFLALGNVVLRMGGASITSVQGLGRRMPWTMAAFVVGGLSLIGVPFTVGFVSKWYLILAALEAGLWPVAILIVLGSLLAIVYVWRVVEAAYFQPAPAGAESREAPLAMLIPTWILVLTSLYFGLDTRLTLGVADTAARLLMGVVP